ncbi:MAG: hypothetical protein ACLRSW_09730 [Christensenellaceae bacterium]
MQVRNQSYLRRKNKNSIIELLRKKTQSYSDLARELKLSNTAIANIVDDLISENVVYRESDSKGRGGINSLLTRTTATSWQWISRAGR